MKMCVKIFLFAAFIAMLAGIIPIAGTPTPVTQAQEPPSIAQFDKNGNGMVEKEEAIAALNSYLVYSQADKALAIVMVNGYLLQKTTAQLQVQLQELRRTFPPFEPSPRLIVSPQAGEVGTLVTIEGSSFAAGSIKLTVGGLYWRRAEVNPSGDFTFQAYLDIQAYIDSGALEEGLQEVKATDVNGNSATTTFRVGSLEHHSNPDTAVNCSIPIPPDYLGNYPQNREPGWSSNLQGVANDANNWYITQTQRLWKFPVGHDLNSQVDPGNLPAGVMRVDMPQPLKDLKYNHFGDLDYWMGQGSSLEGDLFVPIEGEGAEWGGIALFRASDLEYRGCFQLLPQRKASWCAVFVRDGVPYLYTSDNSRNDKPGPTAINCYDLRGALPLLDQNQPVQLGPEEVFSLRDEGGNGLKLKHVQGGDFTDSGCLYLVNGYCTMSNADLENSGIMIFNQDWTRVAKSNRESGLGGFKYKYNPGTDLCREEPEGITIWDLDDGRARGIRGHVHVIMIDNYGSFDDDLYFKHYETGYWVQIYENKEFSGRNLVIPFEGMNSKSYAYFGVPDLAFNEIASSVRWYLPSGYRYVLFENANYLTGGAGPIELWGRDSINYIPDLKSWTFCKPDCVVFNDKASSGRFEYFDYINNVWLPVSQ